MLLASAAAIALAGALIGATGIGGVLVVPVLTQLEGLGVAHAVAASSLAFAFPGLVSLWWLRQPPSPSESVPRRRLVWLVGGAIVGATLGGWLAHLMPVRALLLGLAVLALGSGLRGLWPPPANPRPALALGPSVLAMTGLAVGLGSGFTGTGGPVILIPLLILARQPMATTVAAAQIIQLPIALCASAAHAAAGSLDLPLACLIGAVLLGGSLAGQWLGRRLNTRRLQTAVSLMLLGTGLWFAWRAAA
jgi:uncharacterized membrane protein YfcA